MTLLTGHYDMENGDAYTGEWRWPSGNGIMTYDSGARYEGVLKMVYQMDMEL